MYRYGTPPNEAAIVALGRIRDVYGIRNLTLDESARTVRLEYDATRLTEPIVSALLRRAGLNLVELLSLIPPQAEPEPQPAPANPARFDVKVAVSERNASAPPQMLAASAPLPVSCSSCSYAMCARSSVDRATGYEPVGRAFDSLRAHHFPLHNFTRSWFIRSRFTRSSFNRCSSAHTVASRGASALAPAQLRSQHIENPVRVQPQQFHASL